jgi:putative DNA primase/helicase
MWREASPLIAGSLIESYLRNRGVKLPKDAPLRYAPALWRWPTKSRHPAMVALIERYDGTAITSHATFLSPEGRKAAIAPARLFPAGANPAGGGVWFDRLGARRELIIAEGVESALSAAELYDAEAAVATLSTHGMRTLVLAPLSRQPIRIFADHDAQGHGLNAARDLYRRLRSEGRDVCLSIADAVGSDANDILLRRLEAHT